MPTKWDDFTPVAEPPARGAVDWSAFTPVAAAPEEDNGAELRAAPEDSRSIGAKILGFSRGLLAPIAGPTERQWMDDAQAAMSSGNEEVQKRFFDDNGNLNPPPGVILSSFSRGIDQLQGMGYGLGLLANDLTLGKDSKAGTWLMGRIAANNEDLAANPAPVGAFKNVGLGVPSGPSGAAQRLRQTLEYAGEAIGEQGPLMVASLGEAAVGRKLAERAVAGAVNEATERGLTRAAERITERAAAKGEIAGAWGGSSAMEAGSIYGDTAADGNRGRVAAATALVASVPAGLLDALEPIQAARRIRGVNSGSMLENFLAEYGQKSPKGRLGKAGIAALEGAMTEMPTEYTQTAIEQAAQFSQSAQTPGEFWHKMLSPEAEADRMEALSKAGVAGAGFGGGAEMIARNKKPASETPTDRATLPPNVDLTSSPAAETTLAPTTAAASMPVSMTGAKADTADTSQAASPPAAGGRFIFNQSGNELVIEAPTEDIAKEYAFRAHPGAEFVRAATPAAAPAPAPEALNSQLPSNIEYSPMDTAGGAVDWTEFTPVSEREDASVEFPYSQTATPTEPQTTTELAPDGNKVVAVEMPVKDIEVDPVLVPQFKGDAREDSGEVRGEELKGDTYQRPSNPIVVWQLRNGRNIVVTGRHRFALAKRLGEQTIPATIVREADGFTRQHAITLDAEFNIRDGNGSVDDYANYIENTPSLTEQEARARGLLDRAKGQAAWHLARSASDDLKALYKGGKIAEREAVAIASAAPGNAAAQAIGSKFALAGKSAAFIRNVIQASQAEAGQRATSLDLFGQDDSAMQQMAAQAERASQFQREISEQVRAVQGAAKRPDVARKLGVDVQDPEGVANKIVELKNELARWQNWPLHPDLVAKAKGLPPGAQMSLARRRRVFPAFTTEQLRQALADPNYSEQNKQMMRDEIAARESGESQVRVTPQIVESPQAQLDKKINRLTEKRDSGTRLSVDEEAQLRRLEAQRGQQDLPMSQADGREQQVRRAAELRGQAAELFRRADVEQQRGFNSVHRQEELLKGAAAYRAEAVRLTQLADNLDGGVREEVMLPDSQPSTPSPQLTLFSVNSPAAPTSAVADVRAIADTEAGDAPVRVVHDATLTHNGQMVEGYLDPATGQIVLNAAAPTMRDPANVRRVVREERAHWLLTTPEGQAELRKFTGQMTPAQRAELQRQGYTRMKGESAADYEARLHNEFIAKQARENTVWWRKLVERVREWLAANGLAKLTNEEAARAILRRLNAAQAERQLAHGYLRASNGVLTAPWARVKDILASITAHHGTPHKVDKFSTDKIGTGEGAQVYGWGLYFAENEKVATEYRDRLSKEGTIGGITPEIRKELEAVDNLGFSRWQEAASAIIKHPDWKERWDVRPTDKTTAIDKWVASNPVYGKANKYTVSLNVEPEDLLDWDKPISEQSEKVKAALRPAVLQDLKKDGYEPTVDPIKARGEMSGKWAYEMMSDALAASRLGSKDSAIFARHTTGESSRRAQEASEALASIGIRGIRYLDQGSRSAKAVYQRPNGKWYVSGSEKGYATQAAADKANGNTYNYVIFDENDITITHENGQPVSVGQLVPNFSLAPVTPVSPETQTQIAVIENQSGNVNEHGVAPTLATSPELRSKFRDMMGTVSGKIHYYGGASLLRAKRGIDLTASYQAAAVSKQSNALLNQLFSSAYNAASGFKLPQWMKVGAWANRTREFKKRLLHVAARLNATGRNPDGSFKFDDFKVRSGMMTLQAFKAGKHTVGGSFIHIDPQTNVQETFEIGPLVQTPDGRMGYQLLRSMDANTQAELYRTMQESFPELNWLLDMFIDPALKDVRQTINGIEIPVFNRFAQAAMMADADPNFTPLTGYTPDVLVSRSLIGAIRGALSFSQGTRSPGRKYKFGTSRESGHVRDLLTGFNVRTFQMLQEKARREWRNEVFKAAKSIPRTGVPQGWVKLETGMESLFEAAKRLKHFTSPIDPTTGKPVFPETEKRLADDGSAEFKDFWKEIFQQRGKQLMLPQPLIDSLLKKYQMQKEHGALYKLAAWGVRNSTQLFLVMPKTYVANVLTNDLFAAEAGTRYALRGLMTGNVADLRFARNLFTGTFTNRFAAFREGTGFFANSDYMTAIRETLPDQVFSDSTSLADVKVRWGNSALDYLRQGEIGGAALQLIQYGSIDVRGKQRMAFAFLKSQAVTNAKRAGLKGAALKAAVNRYLANPPVDDRVRAVQIANFELLNYADTPDILTEPWGVIPIDMRSDFSRLVLPFPRFGYHYVTKQLKRASAVKLLLGKVPKGQRADAFADLVTFAVYGLGGGGLIANALLGALGGDDDDDDARKRIGTSTVPVVNADGSVTLKPIDREYVTANRVNISAWARAMGLDTENEDDFWLRVRNYPVLAAAGVTALAYNDAKKHGAALGARQFVSGAGDLASDFFSMGAAVKVPFKVLAEWQSMGKPMAAQSMVDPYATGVPLSFYITEQLTDSFIPGSRQADELIAWINPVRPRRTASKTLDYSPGVVEALEASHFTGLLTLLAKNGETGLQPAGQIDRRTATVPNPSTISLTERASSLGGFNVKAINREDYSAALRDAVGER